MTTVGGCVRGRDVVNKTRLIQKIHEG